MPARRSRNWRRPWRRFAGCRLQVSGRRTWPPRRSMGPSEIKKPPVVLSPESRSFASVACRESCRRHQPARCRDARFRRNVGGVRVWHIRYSIALRRFPTTSRTRGIGHESPAEQLSRRRRAASPPLDSCCGRLAAGNWLRCRRKVPWQNRPHRKLQMSACISGRNSFMFELAPNQDSSLRN